MEQIMRVRRTGLCDMGPDALVNHQVGQFARVQGFYLYREAWLPLGLPRFSSSHKPSFLQAGDRRMLALADLELHSDGWWRLERQRCWRVGSEIMHACV